MIVIKRKRNAGKTLELVKVANNADAYLVTCNMRQESYIRRKCLEHNLKVPKMMTFDEFIWRNYDGKGVKCVVIDDIDILLQCLSIVPVKAITVTED